MADAEIAGDIFEPDPEWHGESDDQEWNDWMCEPVHESKQVQTTDEIICGDIYCSNFNFRSAHGTCNVCKFAAAQKRAREYRDNRNDRKRRRKNDPSWHDRSYKIGTLADAERKINEIQAEIKNPEGSAHESDEKMAQTETAQQRDIPVGKGGKRMGAAFSQDGKGPKKCFRNSSYAPHRVARIQKPSAYDQRHVQRLVANLSDDDQDDDRKSVRDIDMRSDPATSSANPVLDDETVKKLSQVMQQNPEVRDRMHKVLTELESEKRKRDEDAKQSDESEDEASNSISKDNWDRLLDKYRAKAENRFGQGGAKTIEKFTMDVIGFGPARRRRQFRDLEGNVIYVDKFSTTWILLYRKVYRYEKQRQRASRATDQQQNDFHLCEQINWLEFSKFKSLSEESE